MKCPKCDSSSVEKKLKGDSLIKAGVGAVLNALFVLAGVVLGRKGGLQGKYRATYHCLSGKCIFCGLSEFPIQLVRWRPLGTRMAKCEYDLFNAFAGFVCL